MKQVHPGFKDTLFDWDSEPALERVSRFDSEFKAVAVARPRQPESRIVEVVLLVLAVIVIGVLALAFLRPLLRAALV